MSDHNQGIDLNFRPHSYFWAKEHSIPLLSDIKGAERRKIYESALKAGLTELVDLDLKQHAVSEELRQVLGQIHPAFMGGEYLPDQDHDEVEIARITIASTTQDVTCVYARQKGERIHYRVVDEYNGDTLDEPSHRSSLEPLSLKELVDFFLQSWKLIDCLDCNFESAAYEQDAVHDFILKASSSFYTEFGQLVHARVDEWLDTLPSNEEDDDN